MPQIAGLAGYLRAGTFWGATYDSDRQYSYVNGALLGTKPTTLKTVDKELEIGLRTGKDRILTNSTASDGDFAELLVYDRVLDYNEQRAVEDYLGTKWFGRQPLSPASPFVWLDLQMSGLSGLSCSKETGRLLVTRTENGRDTLWRVDVVNDKVDNVMQIMQGRFLKDAQWTSVREFAYSSREVGHQGIFLGDLSGKSVTPLLPRGSVDWFRVTPDQKKVLFGGSLSNELASGIWLYDLATDKVNALVAGTDRPSAEAKKINSYTGSIRLPSGRDVKCTVYIPPNYDRHKKYPLIIGDTVVNDPIHGPWLQSGIAACGAFVVIVNRSWWYSEIEKWEESVRAVYDYLRHDPTIDTTQVATPALF